MPTITIIESWPDRRVALDEQGYREYTRVFYGSTDDPTISGDLVAAAVPIARGEIWVSPYGTHDPGATARTIDVKQRSESPNEWIIEVKYSSKPLASSGAQSGSGGGGSPSGLPEQTQIENPLARPAEVRWGSVKERVPAVMDRNADAIVNSAGDPFDPPVEIEAVKETVTITWNRLTFPPGTIKKFVGKMNGSFWFGYDPGQVKIVDLTADRHFENGVYFFRVTLTVEVFPGFIDEPERTTWAVQVLDAGFRQKDPVNFAETTPIPILDSRTGRPVSKPQLLDGDGNALNQGADPHWLVFEIWPFEEFDALIQG